MVKLHEKWGKKGFNIVSVTREDAGKVGPFVTAQKINYFTAINGDFLQSYGVKGYPTMMLVDAAGKILSTRTGVPSDAQIQKWVESLVPSELDIPATRGTKSAGKSYDKGDYAKALEGAKKVLSGEEVAADDKKVADRIVELVGLQVEKAKQRIDGMMAGKAYSDLDKYVGEHEKAFKGTDAEKAFKEAEEKLKSKEVKAELKAEKKMNDIVEDYKKAGSYLKKKAKALKAMQKFVEKYGEMACAERAKKLAAAWEAEIEKEKN